MKLLVLACLVVVTSASQRFEDLGEEIASLSVDVLAFDAKLMDRVQHADERAAEMSWYTSRIDTMKGYGCKKDGELQCGGDKPKCISRLLICDKEKDCPNGIDESQCKIFTPVGSKWKAKFFDDTCTKRKPKEIIFTIEEYKVPVELLSYPEVKATGYVEASNDDFSYSTSLKLEGVMDLKPGNNKLYFNPPESDGLAIECIFNGVYDDHCHGVITYVTSGKPCAYFTMTKM